jgi:phenylacetate-CoA ligase
MRESIEGVFNAPIFDSYGSREIQAMAFECPSHEGLHILASHLYCEIINPDGSRTKAGEPGEIILTPYFNYSMPLLRYRIGDMGVWAENDCSCGRKWPLLKSVSGRVTECFYRRDGGIIPPEYFIHLVGVVLNDGWINKFQVIQEDFDNIMVRIIPTDHSSDPLNKYKVSLNCLDDKLKLVMGNSCEVNFEFVKDIPETPSGKYLYTISHVKKSVL